MAEGTFLIAHRQRSACPSPIPAMGGRVLLAHGSSGVWRRGRGLGVQACKLTSDKTIDKSTILNSYS